MLGASHTHSDLVISVVVAPLTLTLDGNRVLGSRGQGKESRLKQRLIEGVHSSQGSCGLKNSH